MLSGKDRCYSEQLLYRFALRPKNTTPERQSRWLNNELQTSLNYAISPLGDHGSKSQYFRQHAFSGQTGGRGHIFAVLT